MSKTKSKTSNRKTEANRHNAAKSTGPRTVEGKGRSRFNAIKHGLRAEQVVVLGGPNPEDPRDFEDLRGGLIDDRKPAGALEELLVERLAVGFWRLRRAYRFEAESIAQANRVSPASKMLAELSPLQASEPVEHVLPKVQNLDKLVRYESMIDRELLRSMALLQRVQQRRKLDEQPADPFDTRQANEPSDEVSTSANRVSEGVEESRIRGVERKRVSDCAMRQQEGTPGPRSQASARSLKPEARISDPAKTPVAERTQTRASTTLPRRKAARCGACAHDGRAEGFQTASSGKRLSRWLGRLADPSDKGGQRERQGTRAGRRLG